jgi:accessory colonization factor AcfC
MKEAAVTFGREHHLQVVVTGGPTSQWLPGAKQDGDLIYSGSEDMMSDFVTSLQGVLDSSTIVPLYLRESAILVRPGNPGHISGYDDLLKPGHHILVVNGAGQRGLWEDVAGREGDMASVSKFRANIAVFAPNSGVARTDWIQDKTLDAWLIWNIWQISNPSLAEVVRIDVRHRIYRDCGIGLTVRGASSADARAFIQFLQSPEGAKIFEKWGWNSHRWSPGVKAASSVLPRTPAFNLSPYMATCAATKAFVLHFSEATPARSSVSPVSSPAVDTRKAPLAGMELFIAA